jgi:hypothetical protein
MCGEKSPHSKQIEIRVDAAPGIPGEAWQGYFGRKVMELGRGRSAARHAVGDQPAHQGA